MLAAAHYLCLLAAFTAGAATLEKETAFGQFAVARQFGGRRYLLGQQGHTQARYRFKQQARIGMARLIEHLGGVAQFDDLPQIHHRHAVGHMAYH